MRNVLLIAGLLLVTTAALAEIPARAVLHKEAGNHFLKQRSYEQARDQYLASLQLAPDYEDAHYNLAVIYFFRLDDYNRALYHFGSYARLAPDAADMDQVEALSRLALNKIEEQERTAYAAALRTGTVASLRSFLAANPGTWYAPDVERRLHRLQN